MGSQEPQNLPDRSRSESGRWCLPTHTVALYLSPVQNKRVSHWVFTQLLVNSITRTTIIII